MASITIREVDGTIYGLSNTTVDNVVFVPGTATTGPNTPVLCRSYKEFTKTFGDNSPIGSKDDQMTNWEYAANILIAGFPVLFQRITKSTTGTSLVTAATSDIKNGETTVGSVTELYGGTFGNNLKYSFVVNTGKSVYFRVHQIYTLGTTSYTKQVESLKITDLAESDTTSAAIGAKIAAAVGSGLKTDYVLIEVVAAMATTGIPTDGISETALAGGTDADDFEAQKAGAAIYVNANADGNYLKDKLIYDIKFITSGGWTDTTYGEQSTKVNYSENMKTLAEEREDCIAILDIPYGEPSANVRTYFTNIANINSSYCAAYAPWAKLKPETTTVDKWVAPSFIFLRTLAYSIKSGNKLWFPPAGVRRASVGNIVDVEYQVGSALLDEWQNNSPQYVNPIMKLLNYGYVIYGQRTLYRSVDGSIDNRSALQELGVRITANEIKRYIRDIAVSLTFEHNNIHTWNEFTGALEPKLLTMKTDGALYSYEIIMDETTTVSSDIDENRIVGVVRANIARAAEDFEIGFELTSSSVSLTES